MRTSQRNGRSARSGDTFFNLLVYYPLCLQFEAEAGRVAWTHNVQATRERYESKEGRSRHSTLSTKRVASFPP